MIIGFDISGRPALLVCCYDIHRVTYTVKYLMIMVTDEKDGQACSQCSWALFSYVLVSAICRYIGMCSRNEDSSIV
jgi:hypothetical protein